MVNADIPEELLKRFVYVTQGEAMFLMDNIHDDQLAQTCMKTQNRYFIILFHHLATLFWGIHHHTYWPFKFHC